jgi:alpha-L-fucosidase 2
MYAEYEYTNDASYLRSTVYPFIKGVAQFYMAELARDTQTGEAYLPRSRWKFTGT